MTPNLPFDSYLACVVYSSLSCFGFLEFAQRLGAGGAGQLLSKEKVSREWDKPDRWS